MSNPRPRLRTFSQARPLSWASSSSGISTRKRISSLFSRPIDVPLSSPSSITSSHSELQQRIRKCSVLSRFWRDVLSPLPSIDDKPKSVAETQAKPITTTQVIHEYDEEGRVARTIYHIVEHQAFVPCLSYDSPPPLSGQSSDFGAPPPYAFAIRR